MLLCLSARSYDALTTACVRPHVQTHTHVLAMDRRQAVRSLGPLSCTCYQACTCGLSTSWSGWDLDSYMRVGRLLLDAASRLDAFSAYPFWT